MQIDWRDLCWSAKQARDECKQEAMGYWTYAIRLALKLKDPQRKIKSYDMKRAKKKNCTLDNCWISDTSSNAFYTSNKGQRNTRERISWQSLGHKWTMLLLLLIKLAEDAVFGIVVLLHFWVFRWIHNLPSTTWNP